MVFSYSIKKCDKNPFRWYISFKQTKPFSLRKIKQVLERNSYRTLATTPTVMVFESNSLRLTWNSYGLLQVDFNDIQERNVNIVDGFVVELLGLLYPDEDSRYLPS